MIDLNSKKKIPDKGLRKKSREKSFPQKRTPEARFPQFGVCEIPGWALSILWCVWGQSIKILKMFHFARFSGYSFNGERFFRDILTRDFDSKNLFPQKFFSREPFIRGPFFVDFFSPRSFSSGDFFPGDLCFGNLFSTYRLIFIQIFVTSQSILKSWLNKTFG